MNPALRAPNSDIIVVLISKHVGGAGLVAASSKTENQGGAAESIAQRSTEKSAGV